MKIYDNYFDVCRHIERDDPEAFTWKGIESTGLAEVMEEAEKHGYSYKLNCYDEVLEFATLPCGDKVDHHVRSMIFCRAGSAFEGMTYGEVMKAIFESDNVQFCENGSWIHIVFNGMDYSFCPVDFWNTSYQKGE